jgi:GntR family transcriptional regulator of gluconate operon
MDLELTGKAAARSAVKDDARLDRRSTPDQVVAVLREMLSAGQFAPGEPIRERELAGAVGASRGSVREAMSQLAAEGLLYFDPYLRHAVINPDINDVRELLTMKSALEGFAATRAAANVHPGLLAELRALVAEMRQAAVSENRSAFFEIDLAFHETIVRIADHQLLLDNWVQVTSRFALTSRLAISDIYDSADTLAELAERHHALIEPLVVGDVDEARRLAEEHPLDALHRYELAQLDRRLANR